MGRARVCVCVAMMHSSAHLPRANGRSRKINCGQGCRGEVVPERESVPEQPVLKRVIIISTLQHTGDSAQLCEPVPWPWRWKEWPG